MVKFITVMDTVFQGRVAGWRDDKGKPVLYATQQEAELDAQEGVLQEDDEADEVLEVFVTEYSIIDPVSGRVYWTKGEKQ